MIWRSPCVRVLLCLWLAVATGCTPQQPFYFGDDGDLSHYKGIATELDVPDVDIRSLDEVCDSWQPLTLENPDAAEYWNLSLEEAVRDALANSKVMRQLGVSLAASDGITRAADAVQTVYDPALVETNPRFGTEAAMSAFDTQFATSLFWEKIDRPMNVGGGLGPMFLARVDQQDLGTFQSRLSKTNATGGTTSIGYNVYYNQSNSPTRAWPSDWNSDVTAEFRQPLFQGAGVQFNRIAGPGAIPGFNNGVIIARIQTDIALADFEAGVRTFVRGVEQAYWSLYLTYRELETVKAGRDSALETWRRINQLSIVGARQGEADQLAQASEQYWLFVAQVAQRRNDVFSAEAQLRYMMGLAVADGRQIRPADEPTPAKVSFDWRESMCEAMVRNVDLRRQKWRVKEKQLGVIAAKNFLLPRFDAVGQYRFRGLGNDYWYANRTANEHDTSMQSLTGGDYQDWQFGFEFSLPIGFRKEMAGVRHAQLDVAREQSVLSEEELEVSHQLGDALRKTALGVEQIRNNYEYYAAARNEVAAVQAAYETDTITLNVLLEAQRRLADAEIAYYRSLVAYNMAIVDVHYRKGSLLEYNGVWLAEGPWVGKAYFDAKRRAHARDAGVYMDYGFTRPKVISRGAYQQHVGRNATMEQIEGMPFDQMAPETILAPVPEPQPMPLRPGDSSSTRPAVGPRLSDAARPTDKGVNSTVRLAGYEAETSSAVKLAEALQPIAPKPAATMQPTTTKPAATQWKSRATSENVPTTKATWHESDAHPTPAQSAGPASSWKRVQR